MKTIYMTKAAAVLAAVLAAGAFSTTAFAAEQLQTSAGSVTFRKTISIEDGAGTGGVQGTVQFDVKAGQVGDIPDTAEEGAELGTDKQIATKSVQATFAMDETGIANKNCDVEVEFDTTAYTHPGVYYYRVAERDPNISGLTAAPEYRLKVQVVNKDESNPDGKNFKISYATLLAPVTANKTDEITNLYTTYALTLEKQLAGDFANANDDFTFRLTFHDPDTTAHMTSVTVSKGTEGDMTPHEKPLKFLNGTASIEEKIKGGELIRVEGLPKGTTYTISEEGTAAQKYTTMWTTPTGTVLDTKDLPQQTMDSMDTDIIVTNSRSAPAGTGLVLDAAPYGAMLALAVGSGAVLLRKRRR